MASKSLTFKLFGEDVNASTALQRLGKVGRQVGSAVALGLAAAAGAAVVFGVESVKAFADAQESQNKLAFAFTKFPALADTNIQALGKLNTALMKKTRFDDDAIAVGQAQLAQYGLTGDQIKKLTPLMLDYAARTGKDVAGASEDLGKALLGQGRALKDVGIDFVDTGSVAGNFDGIMGGLSATVGGFAEKDAETAAGKLENLRNRFGEVQEKIGEALMPVLGELVTFVEDVLLPNLEDFSDWFVEDGIPGIQGAVDWVVKWKDVLGPAAIAIGVLTAAQWGLNAAMAANPISLVIGGLMALVAAITLVVVNYETISNKGYDVLQGMLNFSNGISQLILNAFAGLINGATGAINGVIDLINPVLKALGMGTLGKIGKVDFSGFSAAAGKQTQKFRDQVQVGIDAAGGKKPLGEWKGRATAFADGGIVRARPGGIFANIGEGKHDEAVIPLTPNVLNQIGGGGNRPIYADGVGLIGWIREEAGKQARLVFNDQLGRAQAASFGR